MDRFDRQYLGREGLHRAWVGRRRRSRLWHEINDPFHLSAGVRRKMGRFATGLIHLRHEPAYAVQNRRLFDDTLADDLVIARPTHWFVTSKIQRPRQRRADVESEGGAASGLKVGEGLESPNSARSSFSPARHGWHESRP